MSSAGDAVRTALKAAGFGLMLCIPLLGPLGYRLGLPWASPVAIFGAVPLLDVAFGEDRTNEGGVPARQWSRYHDAIPQAYLWVWLACLVWTASLLRAPGLATSDRIALLVAAGIASAFAACAAHELLHRPGGLAQWSARVAMSMCCYGHFVVEHLHHHATAGRVAQGTVPIAGESLYRFILRNARFGLVHSYRMAEAIRCRQRRRWTANRVVQQHALTLLLLAGWLVLFRWTGLLLFVAQALIAIATVEMVQYFDHYGLVRGDGEALGLQHAWNSNGWMTNAITLNITRHSHHHLDARVPYQALRLLPQAPRMPCGYFGLAWLALVPAVWRHAIDRRLLQGCPSLAGPHEKTNFP
jgi:alkane 1-monooxygenase